VFVRGTETGAAGGTPMRSVVLEQSDFVTPLPPGTRLVARLESAVSTGVKEPVVAVIEYNFEREGEIVVPAGAKAIGQLRHADRSLENRPNHVIPAKVGIHFVRNPDPRLREGGSNGIARWKHSEDGRNGDGPKLSPA